MMPNLDLVPVPNPNVVGRIVDDEAVLVLPEKGKVKVLNEVGARIWSLADGKRSVRSIAEQICREYQVEQDQAEADAWSFVTELVERGVFSLPLVLNGD